RSSAMVAVTLGRLLSTPLVRSLMVELAALLAEALPAAAASSASLELTASPPNDPATPMAAPNIPDSITRPPEIDWCAATSSSVLVTIPDKKLPSPFPIALATNRPVWPTSKAASPASAAASAATPAISPAPPLSKPPAAPIPSCSPHAAQLSDLPVTESSMFMVKPAAPAPSNIEPSVVVPSGAAAINTTPAASSTVSAAYETTSVQCCFMKCPTGSITSCSSECTAFSASSLNTLPMSDQIEWPLGSMRLVGEFST